MTKIQKVKKILYILLLGVIFGVTYSFFYTVYENIKVDSMISSFVSRADEDPEIFEKILPNGETYIRKYYEVTRETSDEFDGRNVFFDDEKDNIGQIGDIYVTQQSPFPTIFGFHQFMSYYYGGHAAIKSSEFLQVEATGYPDFENESLLAIIFSNGKKGHGFTPTADESRSDWMRPSSGSYYFDYFYKSRYIGLRPVNPFKGLDDERELYDEYMNLAIEKAQERIEEEALYNFLFFLNMKRKYYCTDFVSRMYEDAYESVVNNKKEYINQGYAKRFNDDGFITSVNDLILTKDTFMTFYVEINEEDYLGELKIVENIYYLADI